MAQLNIHQPPKMHSLLMGTFTSGNPKTQPPPKPKKNNPSNKFAQKNSYTTNDIMAYQPLVSLNEFFFVLLGEGR